MNTSDTAQQSVAVDEAVGTVTRVGSFEVQEHRIELDPEFDERLNNMPDGAVVRLYAAPVRDLTQQQLAAASAALAQQPAAQPAAAETMHKVAEIAMRAGGVGVGTDPNEALIDIRRLVEPYWRKVSGE